MKLLRVSLVILSVAAACAAQDMSRMTTYALVFLKKGPNWKPGSTPELERLQQGHLAHLTRMTKEGKMLLAGPFTDGKDPLGICLYTVPLEEARSLAETDPSVQAGRLAVEVRPWMSVKGINAPDWTK